MNELPLGNFPFICRNFFFSLKSALNVGAHFEKKKENVRELRRGRLD